MIDKRRLGTLVSHVLIQIKLWLFVKSSMTTDTSESIMKSLPNIHPGEVLLEEFLTPLGISQNALARAAGVPPRRINEIVLGKRGVTTDKRRASGHDSGNQ